MGADGDEQRLAAPVLRVMALSPVAVRGLMSVF